MRKEQNDLFFYEELFHDMKTPISILFAYIQLLERMNGMPAQALIYLCELRKHCLRMAKLLRDANDGARLSKGMLLPQFVNTDIVSLVKNICDDARILTDPRNIRICFNSRMPMRVTAVDRQLTERIVLNLLSNAKEYSREGEEIHVSLYEDEGFIHISVRDFGPGIAEEMAGRVFARGEGETGRGTHSGLGLYIVRELAVAMGGDAYLTGSKPGTEVVVRLPVFFVEESANILPVDDFFYDNMVQMELSF